MRCLEWFDLGIQMFWPKLLVALPISPNVNHVELLKVSNGFLSAKCMIHPAFFFLRDSLFLLQPILTLQSLALYGLLSLMSSWKRIVHVSRIVHPLCIVKENTQLNHIIMVCLSPDRHLLCYLDSQK